MAPAKASPGHFRVLYFATAAEFTGKSGEEMSAPSTSGQLYESLEQRYPGIKGRVLGSSRLMINLESVEGEGVAIAEGDEVAIVPPVSAG